MQKRKELVWGMRAFLSKTPLHPCLDAAIKI